MTVRVDLAKAAHICGVKPGTIRKWVFDGRISRHPDECVHADLCSGQEFYDVDELLHWIDARNPEALYSRAGLKLSDRPGRMAG